jgi:hypothetical protein
MKKGRLATALVAQVPVLSLCAYATAAERPETDDQNNESRRDQRPFGQRGNRSIGVDADLVDAEVKKTLSVGLGDAQTYGLTCERREISANSGVPGYQRVADFGLVEIKQDAGTHIGHRRACAHNVDARLLIGRHRVIERTWRRE